MDEKAALQAEKDRQKYKSFLPIFQSPLKATKNWQDALEWIDWNDHWRII